METLQKQLTELPRKLLSLPGKSRLMLLAGLVVLVAVGAAVSLLSGAEGYQYAFTNLGAEDSGEVAAALKSAQIPFRLEAGGSALAVPAAKVYEVRLILAAAGLPRGGGIGFELFDRGDLGVSEFTQKVNLRRATEGELARTLGRLSGVRTARVHLTLSEKGLFRDEGRTASATVVLNLQPGRSLNERELAGVQHLVASSVPSLAPSGVTIVDGRGSVLVTEGNWADDASAYQRKLERDFEQRVVGILEPAVGAGQVVARVTATLDSTEVNSTADVVDPEATALRSERTVVQSQNQDSAGRAGLAGAAANQPLAPMGTAAGGGNKSASNSQEEVRNYEVTKTSTRTVARTPRLQRISVAILVDGADGKPRGDAELAQLGELAKRAVGIDVARGDLLKISSAAFSRSSDEPVPAVAEKAALPKIAIYGAAGVGVLLVLVVLALLLRRRTAPLGVETVLLRPGARVSELEAAQADAAAGTLPGSEPRKALVDPAVAYRDRARELAKVDPARAAHLIRAWISTDSDAREVNRG